MNNMPIVVELIRRYGDMMIMLLIMTVLLARVAMAVRVRVG